MQVDEDEFVAQLLKAADPNVGVDADDADAVAAALDERKNRVKDMVSARRGRRATPYG